LASGAFHVDTNAGVQAQSASTPAAKNIVRIETMGLLLE
jgi:hypothetical protein